MIRLALAVALMCCLTACDNKNEVAGYGALSKQVAKTRVGYGQDQWIEMRNGINEWERVGLVFGYADDYRECLSAIAGLRTANPEKEYRCAPAN